MPLHHGTRSKKDPPGTEASRQFLVGWLAHGCLPKPTEIDGSSGGLLAPSGGEASHRIPPRSSKMACPVADDVTTKSGDRASTPAITQPFRESHPIVIDSDGDEVSEANQDLVKILRRILVAPSEWANSISHEDYRALDQEKRPMTMSVWAVLRKVGVDFLLGMYLAGIPMHAQELFRKEEWTLEDLLALPEVEAADAQDQGLYGDFPVGNLKHRNEISCECYVGLSSALQMPSASCTLVSKSTEPSRVYRRQIGTLRSDRIFKSFLADCKTVHAYLTVTNAKSLRANCEARHTYSTATNAECLPLDRKG
jgi:hypothetical protein